MHLVSQPESGLEIAAAAAAHTAQHMETGMSVEFSAASAGQFEIGGDFTVNRFGFGDVRSGRFNN